MNTTTIFTAICNFFLNSIPEEIFLICFSHIIARRFEYLKFSKNNVIRLGVPVFVSGILSNVLRYCGVNPNLILPIFLLSLIVSITLSYGLYKPKEILKSIGAVLLCSFFWIMIEYSYIPLVINQLKVQLENVNNNVFFNFLMAIPERTVEYSLLIYIRKNKFSILKINLLQEVLSSFKLTIIAFFVIVSNIAIVATMWNFIGEKQILIELPSLARLIIIIMTISYPMFNIVMFYSIVYNMKYKELFEKNIKKDEIISLTELAERSFNEGDFKTTKDVLTDIKKIV